MLNFNGALGSCVGLELKQIGFIRAGHMKSYVVIQTQVKIF